MPVRPGHCIPAGFPEPAQAGREGTCTEHSEETQASGPAGLLAEVLEILGSKGADFANQRPRCFGVAGFCRSV